MRASTSTSRLDATSKQYHQYGALLLPMASPNLKHDGNTSDSDDDDKDDEAIKQNLLDRANYFDIAFNAEKGYRGTELRMTSFQRPHMRAMHASWVCFFATFFTQFAMAPLLPAISKSLNLDKKDIWFTNVWMMIGGIPMRFLLGALCEKFGARTMMTSVLGLCGLQCGISGLMAVNLFTLTWVRTVIGAMDTYVPCQYWITCLFVREVAGTAMAVAGGLGSTGSAVTQIILGTAIFPLLVFLTDGDEDLAWRLSLVVPAVFAVGVALYFYEYSDDCPLGNYLEVKRAGLMFERSAMDSFRSGVFNVNSWILFLQFAASCGADFTMCNGAAVYFHHRFQQPISGAAAIAFLYGISALYARALGGSLSDAVGDVFSLRGRLFAQLLCMLLQGIANVWFARTEVLWPSMTIMVIFSIFIQMSMGTCFGIVPYVDGPNTGSVAGIVAAGGNVGGVIFGLLFMNFEYDLAMEYMGWLTIAAATLTPFIVVKGYKGLLFGHEEADDSSAKMQHSPLVVPGKLQHSPHLVSLRRKLRKAEQGGSCTGLSSYPPPPRDLSRKLKSGSSNNNRIQGVEQNNVKVNSKVTTPKDSNQ